jgi:hypothetical protein
MTFSNGYQNVSLELTISTALGRQYYSLVGVNGTLIPNPVVPMLGLGGQLLLVTLLGLGSVMLVVMRRRTS